MDKSKVRLSDALNFGSPRTL